MSMRCRCLIVGSVYHPGASGCIAGLNRRVHGASTVRLSLRREPNNTHDSNAVAVYYKHMMLGYVPRGDAKVVARVMDAGVEVQAKYVAPGEMQLYWPAETKEAVDAEYRRVMLETEGI